MPTTLPTSSATTAPQTVITADPDIPLIRIVREFDAPPAKVYRAHIDPDLVVRWLGPDDLVMTIDRWDARTGGEYRYVHTDADGNAYGFHGSFHELREGTQIVQTFTFEGWPDGVALEKLVLEELPDGRTRLTATSLCDSFADRDAMIASGMEHGVTQGYAKLDGILSEDPVTSQ